PERILALVVRGVAGLTQRIQAVLRRTRGCGGESRQLKDHPRAAIQFRHGEGHVRPFGGHLDLGTGSYAARGYGVLLAIAAENDWRLSRSCSSTAATSTRSASSSSRATSARSARSGSRALSARSARSGSRATSARS